LVSLAAGSFVGTYLSIVSDNGTAIPHHSWFLEKSLRYRRNAGPVRE
jgi:hypothetical protein